jgi:hypothetical protein
MKKRYNDPQPTGIPNPKQNQFPIHFFADDASSGGQERLSPRRARRTRFPHAAKYASIINLGDV